MLPVEELINLVEETIWPETHSVQVVDCAVAQVIEHEPNFNLYVLHVLEKRG